VTNPPIPEFAFTRKKEERVRELIDSFSDSLPADDGGLPTPSAVLTLP